VGEKRMQQCIDDVLDSLSDGFLIIDRDYTIVYANERVAELYGRLSGEIIGEKCHAVFHASPTPCAQGGLCSHREVFTKRQPVTLKHHHHRLPDGSTRILEITAAPLKDKKGIIDRFIEVVRDITTEEKLREELAASHQTLEMIFNNAPFAISFIDKAMRVIRLNPIMEALVGLKTETVRGKHCYDCWGQYARDETRRDRERICDVCLVPLAWRDGEKHIYERNIGKRVIEVVTSPVRDAGGTIIGAIELGHDITKRHEAKLALLESENSYRALFESSPNILCIADFSGIRQALADLAPACKTNYEAFFRENPRELGACLSQLRLSKVNQAALNLFGAASQQELIEGLFKVIGPETVPQTAGGVSAIGRGETSFGHEIVLRHLLSGAKIHCIFRWNVVPGYEDSYQRVILSLTDISARKCAEDKLNDQRLRLRRLSARLVETEEAERRRLARELHDKLGQQLTALGLNLNILEQSLPPEQSLAQHKRIADMLLLMEEMTEQVRDIMADLRPPVLDDYGLSAALRWYGGIFGKRSGIPCLLKGLEIPRLPAPVEMALFRVVQEALNNVAKHSQASRVEIRNALKGNRLSLVVHDNGKGFPEAEAAAMPDTLKLGLISMGERLDAIGGTLAVTSVSGAGTTITVEIGL
jgi:PAS domain S-box-containing protein